jgi:hypothetical protein
MSRDELEAAVRELLGLHPRAQEITQTIMLAVDSYAGQLAYDVTLITIRTLGIVQ